MKNMWVINKGFAIILIILCLVFLIWKAFFQKHPPSPLCTKNVYNSEIQLSDPEVTLNCN